MCLVAERPALLGMLFSAVHGTVGDTRRDGER